MHRRCYQLLDGLLGGRLGRRWTDQHRALPMRVHSAAVSGRWPTDGLDGLHGTGRDVGQHCTRPALAHSRCGLHRRDARGRRARCLSERSWRDPDSHWWLVQRLTRHGPCRGHHGQGPWSDAVHRMLTIAVILGHGRQWGRSDADSGMRLGPRVLATPLDPGENGRGRRDHATNVPVAVLIV